MLFAALHESVTGTSRTSGDVRPESAKWVWWQDRLTPIWKGIGGGCHLNRAIGSLIESSGFQFERLQTGYMRGPKSMRFIMYEGSARLR
jgi:hypothetical protein